MNSITSAFADHLAGRLGSTAAAPPELAARVEAAAGPGAFAAICAPPDAAGVAAVLALCSGEDWPVRAAGAATWLNETFSQQGLARRPPVLLSTIRLNAITEHEPADLVVGLQAGMRLDRLRAALSAQEQWLPLDPPAASEATIGAMIALGAAGPLRAAYGTPRDMAVGLEVATGDGRLLRFGGRVVKNVAGYDGVRLLTGSRGTLGVITGIYLRVRGAPRADHTLAIGCSADDEGARRGSDLAQAIRSDVSCDALELVSPAVAARIGAGSEWTLLARLLGNRDAVAEAVDRVRSAARTGGGPIAELPGRVWLALAAVEADAGVAMRLTGPATDLASGMAAVADCLREGGGNDRGEWLAAAHAADGVIRVWRSEAAHNDRFEERLRYAVTSDWTVRCDTCAPRGPGTGESVRELTRRLRSVFDPAGILTDMAEAK